MTMRLPEHLRLRLLGRLQLRLLKRLQMRLQLRLQLHFRQPTSFPIALHGWRAKSLRCMYCAADAHAAAWAPCGYGVRRV